MGIFGNPARAGRALAAALLLSACLQPLSFNIHAQAQDPKRNTDSQQSGDTEATRPRRVGSDSNIQDEPLIRIGLMTDVTSVSLNSDSGLVLRRSATDERDKLEVASGELRVELRRQPGSGEKDATVYNVEVAVVSKARDARKIGDEMKKDFKSSSVAYDERAKKYRILIGPFSDSRRANDAVKQLRRNGYSQARTVKESEKRPDEIAARRPASKAESRPVSSKPRISSEKAKEEGAPKLETHVTAFESERMIASSADRLVILPAASGIKYKSASYEREKSDKPPLVRVGKKDYRGEIHIALNPRGRMNVINVLPLEDYLRGVVPLELHPVTFPEIEALKAQAVAARTYALSHRNRYGKEGFDLLDDTRSQIYGGFTAEHSLTNRAIEETRGFAALYINEDGRALPIEAVYTSTCGGRTENNEAVFLTRPLSYLRSVECSPELPSTENRAVVYGIKVRPLAGPDGRSIAREVALLEVMGFDLPRQITGEYLRGAGGRDEALDWAKRAARLFGRDKFSEPRGNITRLPAFASLVASSVYGSNRPSLLLSPADVDYVLAGLEGEKLPTDARADIAMLIKEGILRLQPGNLLHAQMPVTRAWAMETFARALSLQSQSSILKFHAGIAKSVDGNRVSIARQASQKSNRSREADEFEIEKDARLFRRLGGESHAVDQLAFAGGERVTYHLDAKGRVDFLEAEFAERGASSDRWSSATQWQERISAEDLGRRLARVGVNVGEIEDIEPTRYGASNRVIEMDVIGKKGRAQLRGYKIRTGLGLKEMLFVIDRERDGQDRISIFIFSGRGWGHGVGMCQTGAYGLAKEGYSYTQILRRYYTGAEVRRVY